MIGTLILAACGGSSTTSTGAGSTTGAGPTGPPTATVTAQGDASVAGTIKVSSVQCSEPRVNGPAIRMLGHPPGQTAGGIDLVMTVQAKSVNVRAAMGSGATYSQREFSSAGGVSAFDAAKGAKVDATLTEIPQSSIRPETIGAVTAITMTVDCANQQPGMSSVTVTGTTAVGDFDGKLTSARVDCGSYPQGKTVGVTALTHIGAKPVLIIVAVFWMGISVSSDGRYYTNTDTASGTVTGTMGHWNGEVTDAAAGAKLHVAGDATCGSSTAT
jgi:hypothetical protein